MSGGPFVRKGGLQSRTKLLWVFDADAEHAHRFSNFRKAGILQIGTVGDIAAALHFDFDESQRSVVEDHDLHGRSI